MQDTGTTTRASGVMRTAAAALKDRRGAAMVEYALLAALVAVVATVSLRTLGQTIANGGYYLAMLVQAAGR